MRYFGALPPLKISRKLAERVGENCLCKIFLFWVGGLLGGLPSLESKNCTEGAILEARAAILSIDNASPRSSYTVSSRSLFYPEAEGAARAETSDAHQSDRHCWRHLLSKGTKEVGRREKTQRSCATKTSPNFRLNFLVRFPSNPLFYWVAPSNCSENSLVLFVQLFGFGILLQEGKRPPPPDKIQHLDFTKDPRPLYYKTPPCAFYHENVCSKAVFSP